MSEQEITLSSYLVQPGRIEVGVKRGQNERKVSFSSDKGVDVLKGYAGYAEKLAKTTDPLRKAALEMDMAGANFALSGVLERVGQVAGLAGDAALERGEEEFIKVRDAAKMPPAVLQAIVAEASVRAQSGQQDIGATLRKVLSETVNVVDGVAGVAARPQDALGGAVWDWVGPGSLASGADRAAPGLLKGVAVEVGKAQLRALDERMRVNGDLAQPVPGEEHGLVGRLGMERVLGGGSRVSVSGQLGGLGNPGGAFDYESIVVTGLTEEDKDKLKNGTADQIFRWTKGMLLRDDIKPEKIGGWLNYFVPKRGDIGLIENKPAYERLLLLIEDHVKIFTGMETIENFYQDGGESECKQAMMVGKKYFGGNSGVELLNRWWKAGAKWMIKIYKDETYPKESTSKESKTNLAKKHIGQNGDGGDMYDWVVGEKLMILMGLRAVVMKNKGLANPESNRLARVMNAAGYLRNRILGIRVDEKVSWVDQLKLGSKAVIKTKRELAMNTLAGRCDVKVRSLFATMFGKVGDVGKDWIPNNKGAELNKADADNLATYGLTRDNSGEINIVDEVKFVSSVDFEKFSGGVDLIKDYMEIVGLGDTTLASVTKLMGAIGECETSGKGKLPVVVETFIKELGNPKAGLNMSKSKWPPLKAGVWGYEKDDEVFDPDSSRREKFLWGLIGFILEYNQRSRAESKYARSVKGMWDDEMARKYVLMMTTSIRGVVSVDSVAWAKGLMQAKGVTPPSDVTATDILTVVGGLLQAEK